VSDKPETMSEPAEKNPGSCIAMGCSCLVGAGVLLSIVVTAIGLFFWMLLPATQQHFGEPYLLVGATSAWMFVEVERIEYRAPPASPDRVHAPLAIVAAEIDRAGIRSVCAAQWVKDLRRVEVKPMVVQGVPWLFDSEQRRLFRWDGSVLEKAPVSTVKELFASVGVDTDISAVGFAEVEQANRHAGWQEMETGGWPVDGVRLVTPPVRIWWREMGGKRQLVAAGLADNNAWEKVVFEMNARAGQAWLEK